MGFTLYQTGMLPELPEKLNFDEDNITIGALFQQLAGKYGENVLAGVLDRDGEIEKDTMIVLNSRIIRQSDALETLIPPDSELLITVQLAGG